MSNADVIASYFANKGVSKAGVAGLLGNFQAESNFNPSALNANEGAIGIAQWEGGRRTALRQFASSRGTSETDLQTQLDFAWNELNGPYSSVLSQIRNATDPGVAATIVDAQYEVSSGSTRGQRITNARAFFINGVPGGAGGGSGGGGAPSGGGGASGSPADWIPSLGGAIHDNLTQPFELLMDDVINYVIWGAVAAAGLALMGLGVLALFSASSLPKQALSLATRAVKVVA